MILLTDVAAKLEELLNNYDLSDYLFVVKSSGYHLDSIANKDKARNQIPVFVSQVAGEYNPVPNLHQINTTYEINIYYPVRFKEDFYNLNAYLEQLFVGKQLSFGTENALCNVSVATYGEIIQVEAIREFENWVEAEYNENERIIQLDRQVNEFYMSMQFRLFCTTLGTGFIFGNNVKYKLTATVPTKIDRIVVEIEPTVSRYFVRSSTNDVGGKYCWYSFYPLLTLVVFADVSSSSQMDENTKFYTYNSSTQVFTETTYKFRYIDYSFGTESNNTITEELVWDQSGTGASISPVSEQLIGVDKFVRNIENITNFNKSITVYVKNTDFWQAFLHCYNAQRLDLITSVKLVKTYYFNNNEQMTETYNQVLLSYNENVSLGDPLSFTLTFGD